LGEKKQFELFYVSLEDDQKMLSEMQTSIVNELFNNR
jgi:hypothetical protein